MNAKKILCFGMGMALAFPSLAQSDYTAYVNPFVGTGGHGHTYPGAVLPFGMVQVSPDSRLTGWDGCSGYHHSDSVIFGFSHTHLSGTGCSDYGDILLMPQSGKSLEAAPVFGSKNGYASAFSHEQEKASPGYYSVLLKDDKIMAELSATERVAIHKYSFTAGTEANVVLDLCHRDEVLDAELLVLSDKKIQGKRISQAWAREQHIYFTIEFSEPILKKGYGKKTADQALEVGKVLKSKEIKALFEFGKLSKALLVKVAISFVDTKGSEANLAKEAQSNDFEYYKKEAKAKWQKQLAKIEVKSKSKAAMQNFYTALYHCMIVPNIFSDVDGRYRGMDHKIYTGNSTRYTVFSLWDTFRATHPLYTIIEQQRTGDFIQSFLGHYRESGRLPIWELACNETYCMIGYHSVSVITDAYLKGITGFNANDALSAMLGSANKASAGYKPYVENGFISSDDEGESVSKTLEYAYDDWCIAIFAQKFGRQEIAKEYFERALNYKNVFDKEIGFMRPRKNGGWIEPFNPREVTFHFTEANSWQYNFFVPQDMAGFMELLGGQKGLEKKLDELFNAPNTTVGREQVDITGLIGQYAHGNEPSHHIAYLYNYAGVPHKTQKMVRHILDSLYSPKPDGLCGNEDCGQMSAWYVLSALGIYPVAPGQSIYDIGSPIFESVKIHLENGKTTELRAPGNSSKTPYIAGIKVNGQPYSKLYFDHSLIASGAKIEFSMSAKATDYGKNKEAVLLTQIPSEKPSTPIIQAEKQVFEKSSSFSLKNSSQADELWFGMGKSPEEAKANFKKYQSPVEVTESAYVVAYAVYKGQKSGQSTAYLHKRPNEWSIQIESKYNRQYTAGGDLGLLDGLRGGEDFRTGGWQGYQAQDFSAIIDMGKEQLVKKISAGFLVETRSWIFLPTLFEVYGSSDGKTFQKLGEELIPPSKADAIYIINPSISCNSTARYIKVKAKNFGKLPEWHLGAGGDAFIFIDEITIE